MRAPQGAQRLSAADHHGRHARASRGDDGLDFAGAVVHLAALVATERGVVGRDPEGDGVVAELTGVLRAVGEDPGGPPSPPVGPVSFGFEGQDGALTLDPDAFVAPWSREAFLRVELTLGSLEVSGPIRRPEWF